MRSVKVLIIEQIDLNPSASLCIFMSIFFFEGKGHAHVKFMLRFFYEPLIILFILICIPEIPMHSFTYSVIKGTEYFKYKNFL